MDALTVTLLFAYGLATTLYLAFHIGVGEQAGRLGRYVLAGGWLIQLVDIGVRCFASQHPASSPSEAMAFVAWIMVGGFLFASLRYRLAGAGGFAVPAALVLLVLARVIPGGGAGALSVTPLGLVHIILSTVGVAVFAVAAILAGLYLLQERQLKRRQFALMRAGSAPLVTLDRLAAACVKFGFPVFTVAIVTGAVWVARLGVLRTGALRPEYLLAVGSWVVFGALLVARAVAGWQGRRAAWLTVGGFSGALLVLVGYFLRHAV
jgi:ABC-type uncharacterized transport system permease subunit